MSKRANWKKKNSPQPWDEWEDGSVPENELMKKSGLDRCTIKINNHFQVWIREEPGKEGWPDMIWLSIKRHDREAFHDWRIFQRIKNELVGVENEAVEIYPAESRKVDTANQYHLWVIKEPGIRFPFGFDDGRVVDYTGKLFGNIGPHAVQRPLDSNKNHIKDIQIEKK